MNIHMKYEITRALGLDTLVVDYDAVKKKISKLNDKLVIEKWSGYELDSREKGSMEQHRRNEREV